MTTTIYWLIIFSLFATCLWSINRSNQYMDSNFFLREEIMNIQDWYLIDNKALNSLVCKLYPDMNSVTITMGKRVNGSVSFEYRNFGNNCTDDVYHDVSISLSSLGKLKI